MQSCCVVPDRARIQLSFGEKIRLVGPDLLGARRAAKLSSAAAADFTYLDQIEGVGNSTLLAGSLSAGAGHVR